MEKPNKIRRLGEPTSMPVSRVKAGAAEPLGDALMLLSGMLSHHHRHWKPVATSHRITSSRIVSSDSETATTPGIIRDVTRFFSARTALLFIFRQPSRFFPYKLPDTDMPKSMQIPLTNLFLLQARIPMADFCPYPS